MTGRRERSCTLLPARQPNTPNSQSAPYARSACRRAAAQHGTHAITCFVAAEASHIVDGDLQTHCAHCVYMYTRAQLWTMNIRAYNYALSHVLHRVDGTASHRVSRESRFDSLRWIGMFAKRHLHAVATWPQHFRNPFLNSKFRNFPNFFSSKSFFQFIVDNIFEFVFN